MVLKIDSYNLPFLPSVIQSTLCPQYNNSIVPFVISSTSRGRRFEQWALLGTTGKSFSPCSPLLAQWVEEMIVGCVTQVSLFFFSISSPSNGNVDLVPILGDLFLELSCLSV